MALRPILDHILPVPDPLLDIRVQNVVSDGAQIFGDETVYGDLFVGSPPVNILDLVAGTGAGVTAVAPIGSSSVWKRTPTILGAGSGVKVNAIRWICGGGGALGIRYSEDVFASTTLVYNPGGRQYAVGYGEPAGVSTAVARSITGVQESVISLDAGDTWSTPGGAPPTFTFALDTPIVFDPVSGLFIAAVGSTPFGIETSPDGFTWTPVATPLEVVSFVVTEAGRVITAGPTGFSYASGAAGPYTASGGAAGASASTAIVLAEELGIILAMPPVANSSGYVSRDGGATFDLLVYGGVGDAPLSCRVGMWVPESRRFYFTAAGTPGAGGPGPVSMWSCVGEPSSVNRLLGTRLDLPDLGLSAAGSFEIAALHYDSEAQVVWMGSNSSGGVYYTYPGPGNVTAERILLRTAIGGRFTGTGMLVEEGATLYDAPPSRWALSAIAQQLSWSNALPNGLATAYPIAGSNATPLTRVCIKFDPTLAGQTLFSDSLGFLGWDAVNKQLRITLAQANYYGSSTAIAAVTSFANPGPFSTATSTSPALALGGTYYAANFAIARNATYDLIAATPMKQVITWASVGLGVPASYTFTLIMSAGGLSTSLIVERHFGA